MTHLIYLAEPIDLAQRRAVAADEVWALLRAQHRYAIYRPAHAWKADGATPDGRLDQANRAALDQCDIVVAVILKNVPSVGVPMEIQYALSRGIPVICLTDHDRSWSLVGGCRDITTTDDPEKVLGLVADTLARPRRPADQQHRPGPHPLPVVRHHPDLADPGSFTPLLPTRAYPDDAGLDLYVSADMAVPAGAFCLLECGIAVELPPWSWGLILGRSSTMRDRMLFVTPAVIDAGWRGPLNIGVLNVSPVMHRVRAGDRLAQLIIMNNYTPQVTPVEVETLTEHARGTNGFGSTGR